MGVFDIKADEDIITIQNPKWDNEYCRARTVVLVADEEWVQNRLVQIKNDFQETGNRAFRRQKQAMSFDAQIGATKRLWVFRMLKEWNFTKDGLPMPLKLEAVQQLPQHVLDYIYDAIMAAQPKDEEDTEQGGEEDETDPTLHFASDFIDGGLSSHMKEQSNETGARNFLLKS